MRWYQANRTASVDRGLAAPLGLAFDGVHIWVAAFAQGFGSFVQGLRASDGVALKPYFAGNSSTLLTGIAFDGANIWAVDNHNNNVIKVRASDGAVLATPVVGQSPQGVAFDGANIWVANAGSNNVTKLRARDGKLLGAFAVGACPSVWPLTGPISGRRTRPATTSPSCGPAVVLYSGPFPWAPHLLRWRLTVPTSVANLRGSPGMSKL